MSQRNSGSNSRGRNGRPDFRQHQDRRKQDRQRDGGNRLARTQSKGLGGDQIEGRRAVRELLVAEKRRVREVWIAEGMELDDVLDEVIELCEDLGVNLRYASRSRIDQMAMSEVPQGVVAFAAPLKEYELEELTARREDGVPPFLLAFDGVTDPHNLGAVVRTGECAGATGVILPKHRSAHVTPTVIKASAGAVEHLRFALVPGIPAALGVCKEQGVWTVGLDPDGDTDLHDLRIADQPIALVLGAEGAGLSRLTKQRCDVLVRIPQYGQVASLNVSAAAAVACFEIARHRATSANQ